MRNRKYLVCLVLVALLAFLSFVNQYKTKLDISDDLVGHIQIGELINHVNSAESNGVIEDFFDALKILKGGAISRIVVTTKNTIRDGKMRRYVRVTVWKHHSNIPTYYILKKNGGGSKLSRLHTDGPLDNATVLDN